jgi:hypothetical protein
LTHVHEESKQLKEVLVEAAEHSRIPTKPGNVGWFDKKFTTAIDEKIVA